MDFETIIPMALMLNEKIVDSVAKTDEGYPLIVADRSISGRYPLIVINQISGGDVVMADDEVFIQRSTYQVSYYCAGNEYVLMREEISSVLRSLGFRVMHRYVTKSPYTDITNSIVHVRTFMQQENYDKIRARVVKEFEEKYGTNEVPIPKGTYFNEDEQRDYFVDEDDDLIFF